MDESSDLVKGQLVAGRYEILRLIGEGGMGTVYLAHDQHLPGRQVALKALHAHYVGRRDREQRFTNEALFSALTGRLPYHSNIAATIDSGRIDGRRPFIVMEYVDGPAISGLSVVTGRPLSASDVCDLAHGVASAMRVLHDAGLVHRDLTPMNVLVATIGGERVPKVIDLSHAASISGPKLQIGHPDRLTQPHEFPGTPGYMSPEQVAGRYPAPTMDIFSFGVMLWELLADRPAYRERDRAQYFELQRKNPQPPPPLVDVRPDLPKSLHHLIDACTDLEPSLRPSPQRILEWLDAARLELQIDHDRQHGVATEATQTSTRRPPMPTTSRRDVPCRPRSRSTPAARPRPEPNPAQTSAPTRRTRGAPRRPATLPDTAHAPRGWLRRWGLLGAVIWLLILAIVIGWKLLRPGGESVRTSEPRSTRDDRRLDASRDEPTPEVPDEPRPTAEPVRDAADVSPPTAKTEVVESPAEPQAPEPPPEPKTAKPTRSRKDRRRPTPSAVEECTDVVADAEQASRSRQWKRVLKLTKSRRCWDDEEARVWLRVRALLELRRYAECAALGSSSTHAEAARSAKLCASQIAEESTP